MLLSIKVIVWYCVDNKLTSSLAVSLGKAFNGMLLPLSGKTSSNRWQLDLKTEKIPSLSPGRGTLANI